MQFVTSIPKQNRQRFYYAGNAYVIDSDSIYQEIYFNGQAQLNGFFKKVFKKIGKIVKSPILGVALTAATGGAFGVLSAGQLFAVNAAKGLTGVAGLIQSRNDARKKAQDDPANAAYYAQQEATLNAQILAAGGNPNSMPVAVNQQATDAIQAYANYINAGNDPAKYNQKTPDVTPFGITTPVLAIGGFGVLAVILLATRR